MVESRRRLEKEIIRGRLGGGSGDDVMMERGLDDAGEQFQTCSLDYSLPRRVTLALSAEMKDPFADLIVQNGSTNEGDITRRLQQVKKKLRKKIGNEYDDLPVKIVHSIFKQNFSVLADKYKVEIQLELMKKATAKPGFMRRLLNYFRKKKDPPGIAALNEELYQKVQEAIENWKSGNKRRLSSFFTPRKVVEPPKRDERDSKICYEEDWRKSIADESFFMNSALATSTPTTFGRHAIEKEASKIVGKLNDDPALMREVMNNLPEEAFTCRKNILEPSCSFDEN